MLVLRRAGSASGHICTLTLLSSCCWSSCCGGFGMGTLLFEYPSVLGWGQKLCGVLDYSRRGIRGGPGVGGREDKGSVCLCILGWQQIPQHPVSPSAWETQSATCASLCHGWGHVPALFPCWRDGRAEPAVLAPRARVSTRQRTVEEPHTSPETMQVFVLSLCW